MRNRVGVGRLERNSQAIKPNQHAADPAIRRSIIEGACPCVGHACEEEAFRRL